MARINADGYTINIINKANGKSKVFTVLREGLSPAEELKAYFECICVQGKGIHEFVFQPLFVPSPNLLGVSPFSCRMP